MDLLILKLERIDNTFYENLLKFISGHGYTPKVVIRNTDSLSINGLKIISSKRQLFRHKEEISLTNKEFDILDCWRGIRGRYSVKSRYMIRFGEKTIFQTAEILLLILTKSVRR